MKAKDHFLYADLSLPIRIVGIFGSRFAMQEVTNAGPHTPELKGLPPGAYALHGIARHPFLTIYGSTCRCIPWRAKDTAMQFGMKYRERCQLLCWSAMMLVRYYVGASGNFGGDK